MPLQIPPAVGSSGQFIETFIVTSSQHRHAMVIGDAFSTAVLTVSSSGGMAVFLTNPLAILAGGTVFTLSSGPIVLSSNPVAGQVVSLSSGTVTVANPSTAVNVANSPTVLTASSGYLVRSLSSGTVTLSSNPTVVLSSPTSLSSGIVTFSSAPTVNVSSGVITLSSATSLSSGTVTLSSAPLVIVATSGGTIPVTLSTVFSLSSNPTVVSASSGFVQSWQPTISAAGFGPVTSSYGRLVAQPSFLTSAKLIVATSVSAISASAGILWGISAFTTSPLSTTSAAAFMRLYDQTTGNATSANNSGLAGACMLLRLNTSANTLEGALPNDAFSYPQGIKFATACSFDIVLLATSTATNAIGGWVTAQYTT